MEEIAVNGQSNEEVQNTHHIDIVVTKADDHVVKDANQNTENPDKIPQTSDNTCAQSTEDDSNSTDPSPVVDSKVCDENNQEIIDHKKDKSEQLEDESTNIVDSLTSEDVKYNQESVTTGNTVSAENVQADNKDIAVVTSVETPDVPSEAASKECKDEEANIKYVPASKDSEGNTDEVVRDDPKANEVEGSELEMKTDSIESNKDDSGTEKMDEKMGQIDEQTTAPVNNEPSEDTGINTNTVSNTEEEIQCQDTQATEAAPGSLKQGENVLSEGGEGAVPTTQEATAEVASSVDKAEIAADQNQPTETSANNDEQITSATRKTSNSTWYTDEDENEESKHEGYSTTVVGGVVVRKPLPSSSSPEHKKPSPKNARGSKFKVSWGSIFGRKKNFPKQDKPDGQQTDTAVNETQGDNGTDTVEEQKPVEKEARTSENVDAGVEEKVKSETEASSSPEPLQPASKDEEKSTHAGEIVPLEEGVAKTDVEVAEKEPSEQEPEDTPKDEDSKLRERIAKRESWSPTHSPEKHMQMRVSYAEGSKDGGKEVEVIGTREVTRREQPSKSNVPANYRYSCRELGDVDHEGWLAKRGGGAIFATWKRKWVVLKERNLYYYKTSFDPEAGGVVYLDEKHKATAAHEIKRKFAFRIGSDTPKAHKLYFAADTQEDMGKWLAVLSAASRGETVVRKAHGSTDNVKMRKKTSSATKRAGSVLGIGGLYEYDGNLQKASPTRRRASFGSSPQDNQKAFSLSAITSDGEDDKPQGPAKEVVTHESTQNENQAATVGQAADVKKEDEEEPPRETSSTIEISQIDEVQSAPPGVESGQSEAVDTAEIPCEVKEEISPTQQEPPSESSPSEDDQPTIAPLEQVAAITANINKENVVETAEPRDTTPMSDSKTETMETQEVSQSDEKTEDVEARADTPTSQKPHDPSNTTWYFVLDEKKDSWVEYIHRPKNDDDELLSLVRTIKDARITITGTPLPGNEERGRAMTTVSAQNAEVLRLRELRRTLKDKERDLKAMDELLTKNVNRESIHEWSTRYPCLKEEISGDPVPDNDSDSNSNEMITPQENGNIDENGEAVAKEETSSLREESLDEERRGDNEESKEEEEKNKEKEEPQEDTVSAAEKSSAEVDENKKNTAKSEQEQNVTTEQDNAEETCVKDETTVKEEIKEETLNEPPDDEDDLDTKF